MRFSTLIAPLALAGAAYARIVGIEARGAIFEASDSSTLPVTFIFAQDTTPAAVFGIGFGIQPNGSTNGLGTPFASVDVFGQGDPQFVGIKSYTVTLTSSFFTQGSGSYVITAAVLEWLGDAPVVQSFTTPIVAQVN